MTRSQISTTTVRYIDGIHAPRTTPQKQRVQVSLPLEIKDVASSRVEVRSNTATERLAKQKTSDFYAQAASRAWSPNTNSRLKRKRSRIAEASSKKMSIAKVQLTSISDRVVTGIRSIFRRFQQVIRSTYNNMKSVERKAISDVATTNSAYGSNKMLLTVCLFQVVIILALGVSLYSTNRAYNQSQVQAVEYQKQMREDFDKQLKSLQSEWQGVLKGWQNSQSTPPTN